MKTTLKTLAGLVELVAGGAVAYAAEWVGARRVYGWAAKLARRGARRVGIACDAD